MSWAATYPVPCRDPDMHDASGVDGSALRSLCSVWYYADCIVSAAELDIRPNRKLHSGGQKIEYPYQEQSNGAGITMEPTEDYFPHSHTYTTRLLLVWILLFLSPRMELSTSSTDNHSSK